MGLPGRQPTSEVGRFPDLYACVIERADLHANKERMHPPEDAYVP